MPRRRVRPPLKPLRDYGIFPAALCNIIYSPPLQSAGRTREATVTNVLYRDPRGHECVAGLSFVARISFDEEIARALYVRMASSVHPLAASTALTKENSIPDGRRMLDRQTLDVVYSAAYEELRRLARSVKNSWPACTLTPSTLVHEAWLKLAKSSTMSRYSELQFKYIASQAMYEILVDVARRQSAVKRGGREVFVALDDSLDLFASCSSDILVLRDASGRAYRTESTSGGDHQEPVFWRTHGSGNSLRARDFESYHRSGLARRQSLAAVQDPSSAKSSVLA